MFFYLFKVCLNKTSQITITLLAFKKQIGIS
jgi:hypothetical protein